MSTTEASAPEDIAPLTAVALISMITATTESHPEKQSPKMNNPCKILPIPSVTLFILNNKLVVIL